MKLSDFTILDPVAPEFIGELVPKNRLTVLHGLQGSGKTYSLIKMLNNEAIIPIYIDLDHTDGISRLDYVRVSAKLIHTVLLKGLDMSELENRVIIIDTYSRLHEILSKSKTNEEILRWLEALVNKYKITLIVVGHTKNFIGKDGVFTDNESLVRGCSEELFLEKAKYKKTTKEKAKIVYTLHVNKGRGNGGARQI